MNNDRRKKLDAIVSIIDQARADIESICSDEQDAYDNMPESLQNGNKGETAQEAISALEEAVSNIESVCENLATAKGE